MYDSGGAAVRKNPIRGICPACCAWVSGAAKRLRARMTASPIRRMGTFYEASAVQLQCRVIRHEQQRSDMLLAACLDILPGPNAAHDRLSDPAPWGAPPRLCLV